MTRSLSGRLLIGIVSLVVVGLIVADVATYTALQSFLIGRVDAQLATGHNTAVSGLGGPAQGNGPPPGTGLPADTVIELVAPDGTVIKGARLVPFGTTSTSTAVPTLPKPLPSGTETNPAVLTLNGVHGVDHYRASIWPEDSFGGDYVVLAIPLTDVESTLEQLLQLEVLISLGVVAATAVLALIIIRIGLRPLRRMEAVAQDIAEGDLTRRVEPATHDTEIGRLGIALNGMLSQIEAAFAERTRSEARLRRFIADASHELRTPLTSVRGYAEMLRRGAEKSPEDASLARRRIEEESKRMSLMVDDMLVLARLGQGRPLESAQVDLQAIARDAVADAHAVAPQRAIRLDAPAPVVVTGDDTRLRQAVGNLIRNALVHTPSETPIEVALSTRDGVATMSVVDHGPGLKPDDAGRVFEPFYRADPSRSRDSGGAGLGLSIVAAVVDAHGGQVKVSDTPGGGATFEVELPLKPPPDPALSQA
jgi:two-component system, OmpR family, sensor kinase